MPDNCDPVTIFAALEPNDELWSLVAGLKDQTRALVGEQIYLSDPPHLTVYLAVYPRASEALAAWPPIAARKDDLRLTLAGWQVFAADALTGCHTLVCGIAEKDKDRLRRMQTDVIESLARGRDEGATKARLAARLDFLSEHERRCVERYGFPYVGHGWQPHFTIASIRAGDWPTVWRALEPQTPRGELACSRWRLYRLDDGHPVAIDGLDARPAAKRAP